MTQSQRLAILRLVKKVDGLGKIGIGLSIGATWLLTIIITYDVVLRTFGAATLWAYEVSIYLMFALAFLGAGSTFKSDRHFRVTFIRDLCPPKIRLFMDVFSILTSLVFVLFFLVGTIKLAYFSWSLQLETPTILRVSLWFLQGIMTVGAILLIIAILSDALRILIEGHTLRDQKNDGEVI